MNPSQTEAFFYGRCQDVGATKGCFIKTDMDLQVSLIKIVDVNFSVNSITISSDGLYLYLMIEGQNRFIEF